VESNDRPQLSASIKWIVRRLLTCAILKSSLTGVRKRAIFAEIPLKTHQLPFTQ
jgi:hypothetical protein